MAEEFRSPRNPQTPSDPDAPLPAHMLVAAKEVGVVHTNELTVIAVREGLIYASPPQEWGNGARDWGADPLDEEGIRAAETKFRQDAEAIRKENREALVQHAQQEKEAREKREKKEDERRELERKADEQRRAQEKKDREVSHTEIKHTEVSHDQPRDLPHTKPTQPPAPLGRDKDKK